MQVAVLGAHGTIGGLVAGLLETRGHGVVRLGPEAGDRSTLTGLLAAHRPAALIAAVPSPAVLDAAVPAAVHTGVPLVDASFDQPHLRRLRNEWDAAAATEGMTIVPAAGTVFLVGDLLGAVAAAAVAGTREVHVAYTLADRADLVRGWTRGFRRGVRAGLGGGVALHDGRLAEERAGEARRLAWFPRPIGPHHAAGVPGGEALTLPRHVPGLETVRTYLAVPSLAAEVLQAGARSISRAEDRGGAGGWAARALTRLPAPDPRRRGSLRWACVAEAPAEAGTARAWAYGTDPYAFAAVALVLVAERVADGAGPAGVVAPGQLGEPAELLDELTLRADARWAVSRP